MLKRKVQKTIDKFREVLLEASGIDFDIEKHVYEPLELKYPRD